ncbi:hypothetical protein [Fibrella aestuarina]|nr:hypothetical protein [Fibrella aestuarina]
MSEIDNKPLHDWVRQTLHQYEPPYDPQDWQALRRQLRERRRWRLTGLVALFLLCAVGGYVVLLNVPSHRNVTYPVKKASARADRKKKVEVFHPQATQAEAATVIKTPTYPRQRTQPNADLPVADRRPVSLRLLAPVQLVGQRTQPLPEIRYQPPSVKEIALLQHVLTPTAGPDSTVLEVLSRNLRYWNKAVIVCDLTTSMDPYAAQLYAWFRRNTRNPNVLGTVFFTDCDSLGQETRPGGLPGAFFVTREQELNAALPTMLAAARNTAHNDLDPENVVEALQYAQRTFPQANHLVLLTDNGSRVKDMDRLPGLIKPVHVVACGGAATETDAFQPDQYQIALRTGGSIHTLDDDLMQPDPATNHTFVRLGNNYYRYVAHKGRFIKTRRKHRPLRFLGINW